jgi:deoxyribose-phosphate aldolase
MTVTRAQLAAMIDDTLLEPEVTDDDVTRLAEDAGRLGAGAICVSPSRLPVAPAALAPGMIAAGATRIGTSHTAAILNGVHDE